MADDKPKNADFIGRVVKDAKNPVETRMLSGWFGDSGEKGTRRLYTDAELTSYVDIPDDAILYTEPIKDSQPAGGTLVWIKRDASVQSGGSSASRAGRFLQGQVATDFGAPGSLEKAGLRCVTEVPCGEPTGFTGQCTKQPNVGGAWPCITEVPHCVEVTGFTGKCTNAPWPSPTRYIGCTYLHCPTNDLTHIPHICNIVASGQPGCVVVNPPQGGEAEKKVGAAEEKLPLTQIPGCGYTKTWGLCQTHLLGCGYTRTWGQCPTNPIICDPAGPQANAVGAERQVTNPVSLLVVCTSPVDACPSRICNQTKAPTELCTPAPAVCDTFCGPQCQTKQVQPVCTSVNCVTPAGHACPQPSQPPQCPPPTATSGPIICCVQPQQDAGNAVGAQALQAGTIHPTLWTQIGCPTSLLGCGFTHNWGQCFPPLTQPPHCPLPTGFNCPSQICPQSIACGQQQFAQQAVGGPQQTLATVCTQLGCPTHAPMLCMSHPVPCPTGGIDCTVICPTHHLPQCPTAPATICPTHLHPCPTGGIDCTVICPTHHLPQCPTAPATICPTHLPAACPPPLSAPPQCPIASGLNCPSAICPQSIACQSQACQPQGGGLQQQAQFVGGPQTLATVCTQLGCPTHAPMLCMSHPVPCPTGGIDCTVICPTHHLPQCPTAPATICPTHLHPCPTGGVDCTVICPTHHLPQCPTAPATICPTHLPAACPPLTHPPQCPVASGFNCPSAICPQSIACQSQACQPQGGGLQQQAQFVGGPQTLATVCTQLGCQQTHQFGCPTGGVDCTVVVCTHFGPQCPPHNTLATVCTQPVLCHPLTRDIRCFQPLTQPPQCPIASGFNCPSAICPQSIACQSQACQLQGGGQQQQAQFVGAAANTQLPQCQLPTPFCWFTVLVCS